MSKNLQNCISELQLVAKMKNKHAQSNLLKKLAKQNCFYNAIKEISLNVVDNNIPLTEVHKKILRKHRHVIRALAQPSKRKKIKAVVQSGGALSLLIPLVSALLDSLSNNGHSG